MTSRNLSTIRWIVVADLVSTLRRRGAFLRPAFAIGLLLTIGVGILSMAESAIGFATTVVTMSVVMSATLSLQWVVRSAIADGSIEQLMVAAQPRAVVVAGKTFSHWLLSGLPCILLVACSGLALGATDAILEQMLLTLLVATPVVSLVATIFAMRRTGQMPPPAGTRRDAEWSCR